MKRILLMLAALTLLWGSAMALEPEDFEALPNMAVFLDENGVDTVIRPLSQPFFGVVDEEGSSVCAFLDYMEHADSGAVLIRLTVALETQQSLGASVLTVAVGKKSYRFPVRARETEYDMVFQEDYSVCMTDESLPMIKELASSKKNAFAFTLSSDERTVTGELQLTPQEVSSIYKTYTNLGGHKQEFSGLRELWPVAVQK